MFYRVCLSLVLAICALTFGGKSIADDECGEISIGKTSWASAEIIAEIDKFILSAGYGCDVVLSGGDTMPTFANMDEFGKPDLIPEVWVNTVREQLNAAVNNGRVIIGAEVLTDGGEEGLWIPRFIADDNPEIKTVADALKRPDLFAAPDEPTVGAMHNCPPGWPCRVAMDNLFRALSAEDKGFTLINPGTAAGLDASIAKAYERESGWLGYYWSPTSMLGRYDMVKLDMGAHDAEQWSECTSVPDCADPQVNAWPANQVFSVVTAEFADKAPMAMDYVSRRQWSNKTVNEILAWMHDNQATGEEVAYHFLESYEPVWSAWVSSDVVTKVKDRL